MDLYGADGTGFWDFFCVLLEKKANWVAFSSDKRMMD
jgi:hypothetical protein